VDLAEAVAVLVARVLPAPVADRLVAAARTWRRLRGEDQLPKVIQGVTFRNGVEVIDTPEQTAA